MILLVAAVVIAPRFFVPAYGAAAFAWLLLRRASLPLRWVVVVALALRLPLLFSEPRLSGDVYRYLWDGKVFASGHNPYEHAPDDSPVPRESWHARINHPDIRTIYPPHAQFVFLAARNLTIWRLLIIVFDLIVIALLPRHRLAYATFPLLLFEGTWSGHVDALAASLLAIALVRNSGSVAGIAAGLKIIPLAAIPAMTRSWRFAITFAIAFFAPFLAFLGGPIMPGFRDYATRWIFNSPLYDAVFAIVSRIPTKEIWTQHPLRFAAISDVVYRHVYPDFVTRAILATLAVALIALAGRSVTRALAALILCSPAIHPWYWLVLVPPALLERSRLIHLALFAPFSYLLYGGAPKLLVYALCYLTTFLPSAPATSSAESPPAAPRFRRARGTSPS